MAFALRRAHPEADGVVDVGDDGTRLTLFGDEVPYVDPAADRRRTLDATRSRNRWASTLRVAEERKRHIGFAGAGDALRDELIAALSEAFAEARASGYTDVRNIVLCGNGSRVPGLDDAIERATGHTVRPAALPPRNIRHAAARRTARGGRRLVGRLRPEPLEFRDMIRFNYHQSAYERFFGGAPLTATCRQPSAFRSR